MNDYELIRDILDKSSYTVAMCGTDMMKESGMPSLRAPEIAYQVEKEFGYSPEEIFSSVFYANRPDTFFKYYREWMLKPHLEPSAGFYALAELEKRGKLQCSIANNVHNLPGRAGCQKVLNLHGTEAASRCSLSASPWTPASDFLSRAISSAVILPSRNLSISFRA